ncbi:MAG TPA: hypothetical protein VHG91_04310 [Longimicrobium sp.]|nr:hypothetical protein [Longimicrobium sp.]
MDDRSTATVPRYGLAPPTEDDALAMLSRALGSDRAVSAWMAARAAAGVRGGAPLTPEALLAVAERLQGEGDGVARVVAGSLAVRARTYLLLMRHREDPAERRGR